MIFCDCHRVSVPMIFLWLVLRLTSVLLLGSGKNPVQLGDSVLDWPDHLLHRYVCLSWTDLCRWPFLVTWWTCWSGHHCHRALGIILFPPTTPYRIISNSFTSSQSKQMHYLTRMVLDLTRLFKPAYKQYLENFYTITESKPCNSCSTCLLFRVVGYVRQKQRNGGCDK